MLARDGMAIRKERMDKLLDIIKNHQGEAGWTTNRTTGFFCRQTGATPQRAKEYIQELIDFGLVVEDNGNLKLVV